MGWLAPAQGSSGGAGPRHAEPASRGGGAGGLVERDRDLTRIDRLLGELTAGGGAVVVVEGPAGIGKSEFLTAVAEAARAHGCDVAAARGSEFEAEIPFGVARQVFEPMVHLATPGERRRLLRGVAQVGARAVGLTPGDPPTDQFAAIHGLFWLCVNAAERAPLVVVVDDAQWVDDPSLAWLGYVARRAADVPLVLATGVRVGDAGVERSALAQLAADRGVVRLRLAPLTSSGVAAMVRARLDDAASMEFCAACCDLTGGNPLFVRELVAAASEEGLPARADAIPALRRIAPAAVGTSVLTRLERLGGPALSLARAVAVLGGQAEVVAAARLAELDPMEAELTADGLTAAQILAPARPLRFFHPLIGAAILEDIPAGARRLAHRRAADLLDDGRAESLPAVAAHLLACGPAGDDWVIDRLSRAAHDALERGAPEVAARYLRRALAEPAPVRRRAALQFLLGTAEWRAGESEATAHLEQALATAGTDSRTVIAASAALALAYAESDRAERAVEVLERSLPAIGARTAELPRTEALGTIEPEALRDARLAVIAEAGIALVGMMNESSAPAALHRAEELRARLDTIADPPVYLLVALAYHAARSNRGDDAQQLAERALACAPYPPPLDIAHVLVATLTMIECLDAAQRLCDDLLAAARRHGAMRETVAILAARASASCARGALADAEADARWALERADGIQRVHALSDVIRVLTERDALEAAEDELERVGEDPAASRSDEVVRFLLARGRLRAAQGRLHEALEDFHACGRRCERLGRERQSTVPWRSEAALIHAARGELAEARRLATEQLELARSFGRPRALGLALRALGLVEGGESGRRLLSQAVETLERSAATIELARALCDHGAALRRLGRRVQARTALEHALDLAYHCGARRIAARARAELIAAGAKPRRDAITGRDALTDAELRVARLAADGLTNREIAQALFITTKTAKAHLTRVYRKLDISRRAELNSALTGLVDGNRRAPSRSVAIS